MKKFVASGLIIGSLMMVVLPTAVHAKSKPSYYGPTALCRDGTYSYSTTHKGTCSYHKGVKVWYK